MSFAAPTAVILGLLALPIILLYMLRLRRQERLISSTLFWRELVRDRAANAPWQKLRRNLLLLLQLLILAALVLALAQPYFRSAGRLNGSFIVLLDASASMTATDSDEYASRFDEAVNHINRLIDDINGTTQMTLIAVGRVPVVLAAATNDKEMLRQALVSARPENSDADWPAAFALAAGSSQGTSEPQIFIFSDGGLPATLPAFPGEVTYIPVGRSGDNLAISALGTRSTDGAPELLVSVDNFGSSNGQAFLSIYIDNVLYDTRRIEVGPAEEAHFAWTLPSSTNLVESRLEPIDGTTDYLAVDNRAWSRADAQQNSRVLLVSDGNLFLERLFAILPGYELVRSGSDNPFPLPDNQTFDLYIFDGVAIPNPLPAGNILIFDPQPSDQTTENGPPIEVTGVFTETIITRMTDDPRLADVDWTEVNIAEASLIDASALSPLIEAEGGPLLLVGELNGRRVALFPFDLGQSDLPLQIAFPVIMANITGWLNPGRVLATNESVQSGDIVTLVPDARAESINVISPNGDLWTQDMNASSDPVLFSDTHQTGTYTVTYHDASGAEYRASQFDVNFFSQDESRIAPAKSLKIGQAEIESNGNTASGRLELWPFILAIAFALTLIEWWIAYHRGFKRRFLRFR